MLPDDQSVIDALRAGARGYLTKDAGGAEIRQALLQVLDDHAVKLPAGLTTREAEVLALIADGLSNAQIASRLTVSEGTIKTHINHLLAKTGSRDRAQAVIYAYQHGLVP